MGIRLLVLDIDGTIAGESNAVRAPVRKAIAAVRERGVAVAIATGRMFRSASRFAAEIGANQPTIAYNGAWIQRPGSPERLFHRGVPPEIAAQLLDDCDRARLDSLAVHFYVDDCLHVQKASLETERYRQRSGTDVTISDLRALLSERPPTKILALSSDTDAIARLHGQWRQRYTPAELYLTQSVATFLEVCHPAVNKGAAVRYLAEDLLGLRAEQVMAIGDNFNDLEMLTYAGTGVAMGSAPPPVREVAQWVAPDVEADGVAAAIEQFGLA